MSALEVTLASSTAQRLIEFQDVSKRFGADGHGLDVLSHVSFDVPRNEVTSIVGPSGCGKTTLFSIFAGFEEPTSGAVTYGGELLHGINVGIGYVTQEPNLYPWMTLRENVEFPLQILGVPAKERRERADVYLAMMRLRGFENHYPAQLSGGMQHRAALVRSTIYEPEVILMDEPFSALDMPTKLVLHKDLLQMLSQRSTTVVFITHDISEAITLSDTVVLMTHRPATVKQVFPVTLPRPRDVFHIVREPGFADLYDEIWGALRGEIAEAAAADSGKLDPEGASAPEAVARDTGGRPEPSGSLSPRRELSAISHAASNRAAASVSVSRKRPRARRAPRQKGKENLLTMHSVAILRVALIAGVLGLWQILSSTGVLDSFIVSSPIATIQELLNLVLGQHVYSRTIYYQLSATLEEMAIGFAIGGLAGVILGILLGRLRLLADVLDPFILAGYSVPKIVLAPILVLFFGIALSSKIAVVTMEVLFIVFFNTLAGVRGINEDQVRHAVLMGASRRQVQQNVIIPAAMPGILLGLKLGIPFAMIGAIVGEFIASDHGMGWFILNSAAQFNASALFAAIILLVLTVWLLGRVFQLIESRLLRWTSASQKERPKQEAVLA